MTKYAARTIEFQIGASPSGSVGQVTSLGNAGSSRALIDASAYGDDWTDYVVGQQDGDELAIEIGYDPADGDHSALIAAYDAGTPETFHMLEPESGWHVSFSAIVTACARGGARDGLFMLTATMKILSPGIEDVESS
jgi:hypothetical protein